MFEWIQSHQVLVLGLALALSEGLSLFPGVKSNGVFQLIWNWLKAAAAKANAPKLPEPPTTPTAA